MTTVPVKFLGVGVIVMVGMVCSADVSILSDVSGNSWNIVIFAVSLGAD